MIEQNKHQVTASFNTFITNGIDGWQAGFTIGVQTFYLQPVGCEVGDERDTEERAKWYQGCLEAAFKNIVSKPPSSGANVLVKELENIINNYDHDEDAHKYNNLPACRVCSATKALAQYNAIEPEKKAEIKKLDRLHELLLGHLDKMNTASQELFDEKKINPNNKKGGLQAAWNKLSGVLFSAKVTVQTIREIQSSSQSPQTPIPIEPEGIDGMGVDPL